jgi:hypothetical protein
MDMDIDLSDLKESAVRRLLRTVIGKEMNRSRLSSKRTKIEVQNEDDELDDVESEMEKNASLAMEKKGSPAPIAARESDFREGDVRRALKRLPKSTRGKKA